MNQLTTKLFAAALTLAPATLFAQSDTATTEKKEAKKADQEVAIEANDQMQFNKKNVINLDSESEIKQIAKRNTKTINSRN